MTDKLKLSVTILAEPEDVYCAWLDSKKHSDMTGSEAIVDPKINGGFTAWDGYIEGITIEMEPNNRIVQKWRTTGFPSDSPDSIVEILFEGSKNGTKMILIHTEIPEGQSEEYKKGWKDFYFDPMKAYFKSE
ncbi:MAG: SRPBCC domain-containing protein [Candidatus Thorarchaeota archaeon]|nr:SRPBCC domain-containing protein [Candidatus Thorarchaeota archaeon]